jgi:hypothetical protein
MFSSSLLKYQERKRVYRSSTMLSYWTCSGRHCSIGSNLVGYRTFTTRVGESQMQYLCRNYRAAQESTSKFPQPPLCKARCRTSLSALARPPAKERGRWLLDGPHWTATFSVLDFPGVLPDCVADLSEANYLLGGGIWRWKGFTGSLGSKEWSQG